MKLFDVLGKDAFFITQNGQTCKRTCQKAPDGKEYYEVDGVVYLKNNIGKDTVIASGVYIWAVIPNGNIIYNYDIQEHYDGNGFCINDSQGKTVAFGGISPDGRLVFWKDGYICSQFIGDAQPKVLIDKKISGSGVSFWDDYISVCSSYAGSALLYSAIYAYNGKFLEKETRKNITRNIYGRIKYSLSVRRLYGHTESDSVHYDRSLFEEVESVPESISYEVIEKTAEVLRKLDMLSAVSYNGYLKLKELFVSCGIDDADIEKPLAVVMTSSQIYYGRLNYKVVSGVFLEYISKLQRAMGNERFKKIISNGRLLTAQMRKDGVYVNREDDE